MKLGFVSAILDGWSFEEVIDVASQMDFRCVELACWPRGKAERRGRRDPELPQELLDRESPYEPRRTPGRGHFPDGGGRRRSSA